MAREKLDVARLKDEDFDFLKVGSQIFTIQKVSCDIGQVFDEMRGALQERVDAHINNVNQELWTTAVNEGRREVEHIKRVMQRGEVAVPSALHEKLITIVNNEPCWVKTYIYNPSLFRGTYAAWCNRMGTDWVHEKFTRTTRFADVRGGSRDLQALATLEVRLLNKVAQDAKQLIHVIKVGTQIFTSISIYHTSGSGSRLGLWKRLCTGNMTAETYWALPNMNDVLNSVNLNSLGSANTTFGSITIQIDDFIRGSEVINATRTVTFPDAWRTSNG